MAVVKCRCSASIIFLKTAHGKTMPVDFKEGIEPAHTFDPKQHVSHFATCPDSEKFRKKKP